MSNKKLETLALDISKLTFVDEVVQVRHLIEYIDLSHEKLMRIEGNAQRYVSIMRNAEVSAIESFIHEFSLSTEEGVAIICLAESLLRIPDRKTALSLIEDKLKGKNWHQHLNKSDSLFVNASAWGLLFTGKLMDFSSSKLSFGKLLNKLGGPLILEAIKRVIKVISNEYILGEDIKSGMQNAKNLLAKGYKISFDILGESSRTDEQAEFYYQQYIKAIAEIEKHADKNVPIYANHNLSVKLTALHPRVIYKKRHLLELELLPRLKHMVRLCQEANISLSFDAEEASRQDIYLDILTKLVLDSEFKGFDGIGFVVQGYQKRAFKLIDYAAELAKLSGKRIPLRLVKGAYWDSEIKFAQEYGLEGYPVFTKKEYTDVSYIACAQKILSYGSLFCSQFATHNAHTIAAVIKLAQGREIEFQRLQGMGETLHDKILNEGYLSRIYAPVGQYEDLLAYLMRRLLENGANTSFVNLVLDKTISTSELIQNPISKSKKSLETKDALPLPDKIYGDLRNNSIGYDISYRYQFEDISTFLNAEKDKQYEAYSIIGGKKCCSKAVKDVVQPADHAKIIGKLYSTCDADLVKAVDIAEASFPNWSSISVFERAKIARKIGELVHLHRYELYSLLLREAGKNIEDSIAEVREAIDFSEYYATMAERACGTSIKLPSYTGESSAITWQAKGIFVCISPWNFPLAIFIGQIVAALVTGNTVIAKPAESTSLIATFIAKLIHRAGIPKAVFQLAVAKGKQISDKILSDPRIRGVCFTGSTPIALEINRTLASRNAPIASVIAETGGQNAMIVDSSALLEQAVDSIINSSFGSIGQRCSALRVLYVQEEIADELINLLVGSMNKLKIGDTTDLANDLGPVISNFACKELELHINSITKRKGCKLIAMHCQGNDVGLGKGSFFAPHIISIQKISDLSKENFGPVLHIIRYKEKNLDKIIADINSTGYGLTFGVQTRIQERINYIAGKIHAGNTYANRTIIGAQVGTHPFGGEKNSGTGFKAGGPHYLYKFMNERVVSINTTAIGGNLELLKGIV
jgi:RHH-type proline utilization regulon transcriptional repressor/proline dehydrogenase/delta 1-pyrroline-5-carboxylate dehydrogenase